MSLRKKAVSGIFWAGLEQFGQSGIGFLVQIILARIIAPEQFGIFGLILIFNAIGDTISDSGMCNSLIRTENADSKDFNTVFISNLSISILLYVIIFAIAPSVSSYYQLPVLTDIIRVYSIGIVIGSFISIQSTILRKTLQFKKIALSSFPSLVISSIIGIVLAKEDYGVWAIVYMYLSKQLLAAIFMTISTMFIPKLIFDFSIFKKHFLFGYKIMLSLLFDRIADNFISLAIGKNFSLANVGYYNRANSMKNFPILSINTALEQVVYPLFSTIGNNDNKLKEVYKQMISLVLFVMTPIMCVLIFIAKPFFNVLLTSVWLPSVPYFQILCIGGIFYPLNLYLQYLIMLKGKTKFLLYNSLTKQVLSIIGILILVKSSIVHVSIFISAMNIFSFLFLALFYSKISAYKFGGQLIDIISYFIPSIITTIVVFIVLKYSGITFSNNYVEIVAVSTGFVLVYLFISVITKATGFSTLIKFIENRKSVNNSI